MTLVSLVFFLLVVALVVFLVRNFLGPVVWFVVGFLVLCIFLTYGWSVFDGVPVSMPVVIDRTLHLVDQALRYPWEQFWALVAFIREPATA